MPRRANAGVATSVALANLTSRKAKMVDSNGSSLSRTHLYESLYLICQLTDQLIHHLDRLKSAKILMPGFVEQE